MPEKNQAPRRIHVFGASGSGTTTLGRALAERYGLAHIDTDTFYWLPTDPPFTTPGPLADRLPLLLAALDAATDGWVLSGSLIRWGDPVIPRFDFAVFLALTAELRLARLRERERLRYGSAIDPSGKLHESHVAFMAWAAAYDTGGMEIRSRKAHDNWIAKLPCPVLTLESSAPVARLAADVERHAAAPG
jgi:adenylate kinase family enzyme